MIVLGTLLVAFVGLLVFTKSSNPEVTSDGSTNIYGKQDSKVTLTEYVDFQCEACYAFYPTVKQVKELYKDKVKFQIKNFPIATSHPFARMGATYAEAAARQGKFFEMHDKIFEGQPVWSKTQKPTEYFDTYAEEIGLDMTKLKEDLKSKEVNAVINADLAEVKKLGGNGTPTFALNGKKIDNPENTVEAFSRVLDEALKSTE